MSLIKKPSELEARPTLSALIYGNPGIGKTTLALSTPNPVLFDFDGGVNRVHPAHQCATVQVSSWEEALAAMAEVRTMPEIETIVIDTVGKMLAYIEEYIKRTQPKRTRSDGSLDLQGYGVRKQLFTQFNRDCALMGKNVIYVAHEVEDKRGDDTIVRPDISGKLVAEIIKEMDLVGYMQYDALKGRSIQFDPCDKFYAKNTCNMPGVNKIDVVVDGQQAMPNNYMHRVIAAYRARIAEGRKQNAKLDALKAEIAAKLEEVKDAATANAFIEWIGKVEHVYNSKAYAQQMFSVKVAQLKLTYNKETKAYSDAEV